ncbi:MAG: hypothetical protein ABSB11_10800 [Sedimentisphaerales bacterium]|jgi:hypothetical protein
MKHFTVDKIVDCRMAIDDFRIRKPSKAGKNGCFHYSPEFFLDTDCAVFVQLDVLDKSCSLSKLIRSIYLRPLNPKQPGLLF